MINLIGFFLPPLIDLITRKFPDSDVRFWISLLVCSVVGVFTTWLDTNGFQGYTHTLAIADDISGHILAIIGIAQISYKVLYDKSNMQYDIRKNTPAHFPASEVKDKSII